MAGAAADFAADKALGFMVQTSENLLLAQDGLLANFRASTNASKKFQDSVYQSSENLRAMGLDMKAASVAGTALYNSVTAYKDGSPAVISAMTKHVSLLSELGVNVEAAAGSLQTLTLGLGMSAEEAIAAQQDFIAFAEELQIGPNQAMADFAEGAKRLAFHGPKMMKVLKGLEAQSRATGIETMRLTELMSGFDTFEGAATMVGRMNGLLGGPYLNSIEMVYATEDERMLLMKDALKMSGKSFDSMSKHEQQSIAMSLGMKDAAEAQAFFNGEAAKTPAEMQSAKNQEEMAKNAREMKPIMERLQLAMQGFAISLKPVIEGLASFVEGINSLSTGWKKFLGIGAIVLSVIWKIIKAKRAWAVQTAILTTAEATQDTVQKKGILSLIAAKFAHFGAATAAAFHAGGIWGVVVAWAALLAPILAVVAVVAVVIGAFYLLWKHWSAVTSFIGEAWDATIGAMTDAFEGFGNIVSGIFRDIVDGVKDVINGGILEPLNWMIKQANSAIYYMPGVPYIGGSEGYQIDALAKGVQNFTGGAAIVGEKGPEKVCLLR